MGALAGLAAASKFHFGLWLLTPLLCIWLQPSSFAQQLRLSLFTVGIAGCVVVALVPWFWTNPFLALKEFAGVVLVKVGGGGGAARIPINLVAIVAGLGSISWMGAVIGVATLGAARLRQMLPVVVPTVAGAIALTSSAVVFERYGLVLMPGFIVLAATGWQWALEASSKRRIFVLVALGLCTIATTVSLVRAEVEAGEVDVDVLARNWIVANASRGSHVAVRDEVNAFLPQAPSQLRACADRRARTRRTRRVACSGSRRGSRASNRSDRRF